MQKFCGQTQPHNPHTWTENRFGATSTPAFFYDCAGHTGNQPILSVLDTTGTPWGQEKWPDTDEDESGGPGDPLWEAVRVYRNGKLVYHGPPETQPEQRDGDWVTSQPVYDITRDDEPWNVGKDGQVRVMVDDHWEWVYAPEACPAQMRLLDPDTGRTVDTLSCIADHTQVTDHRARYKKHVYTWSNA